MTCYGVQFEKRCFPIYELVVNWKPIGPDPPPESQSVFDDIRILATINRGVGHISDTRVRENLAHAVQSAARSLELPKGVTLGDGLFGAGRPAVAPPDMVEMNV